MLSRALIFSSLLGLAVFPAACAAPATDADVGSDDSAIVNVPQTPVERQSIGNCWLYAHATWVESMHLSATGEEFDVSQSYWTYWHWFDQITTGLWGDEISTGGNFSTANQIVRKYGVMAEKDFVGEDTAEEMSLRQKSALAALNESLKNGALKDEVAREDIALVRREMDRAWGLSPAVTATLDRVFGATVTRSFNGRGEPAEAAGTTIIAPSAFEVAYPTSPGAAPATKKLSDAMGDWRQVSYGWESDKRAYLQRIQRALHDAQPVIITWFVDFNAMENRQNERRGSFSMATLREFGPGSQGGHMTVLEDYQAKLSDGTLLKAGETLDKSVPAQAELLSRALDTSTEIQFLRVKNSWGSARPDRAFAPGMPGYHDLYLDYLNGPIKQCSEKNGTADRDNCWDTTPLQDVVLPPGY